MSTPTLLRGGEVLLEKLKPITQYLNSDGVTEICVNHQGVVHIEHEGGWIREEVAALDFGWLMSIAVATANYSNQQINAKSPILSATLPGGERIQIVIPPAVASNQVSLTIRRPSPVIRTLDQYEESGLFEDVIWREGGVERFEKLARDDRQLVQLLRDGNHKEFFAEAVVKRKNIAIVGDTGSGKTTFMKTLAQSIPVNQRIITIEDSRELFMPHHDNQVNLLYSNGGQGQADITAADLIRSCMRMKPDRVLQAELRGAEAYDFLKLLTTGHNGSITSFHAGSCPIGYERFALMAKEHPEAAAYADAALKRLLLLTIDVIAHVEVREIYDEEGRLIRKIRRMSEMFFDPSKKLDISFKLD